LLTVSFQKAKNQPSATLAVSTGDCHNYSLFGFWASGTWKTDHDLMNYYYRGTEFPPLRDSPLCHEIFFLGCAGCAIHGPPVVERRGSCSCVCMQAPEFFVAQVVDFFFAVLASLPLR
jgi:hypothetical protein